MRNTSSFINELLRNEKIQNDTVSISEEKFNSLIKKYSVDVNTLTEYGLDVNFSDGVSIKLGDVPVDMESILKAIDATTFFNDAIHFFSIHSTNDLAKELAAKSEDYDGTVLISEYQTSGRGRFTRKWFSRPYKGIYLSFLMKPFFPIDKIQLITLISGLSVKKTLQEIAPEIENTFDIKWPNDVNIFGKKVAGILTETISIGDEVKYIIVGIGINVNHEALNPQIERFATSLFKETGRKFDRTAILVKLLNYANFYYEGLRNEKFEDLTREWEKESSYAYRKKVKYFERAKPIMGLTSGVDENGFLKIKTTDGKIVKILSGEIFEF